MQQPMVDNTKRRRASSRPDEGKDTVQHSEDLSKMQGLLDKLSSESEVRSEMVELGKKLAQSDGFPSSDNLDQLAEALISDDFLEEL